jgi:hypothetical protein
MDRFAKKLLIGVIGVFGLMNRLNRDILNIIYNYVHKSLLSQVNKQYLTLFVLEDHVYDIDDGDGDGGQYLVFNGWYLCDRSSREIAARHLAHPKMIRHINYNTLKLVETIFILPNNY